MIEFRGWPKIARLYRDIVVTEKIDGTNAAIGIQEVPLGSWAGNEKFPAMYAGLSRDADGLAVASVAVYAQSRSRIITPDNDNHGFAAWVYDNAEVLFATLGLGLHFGEWWGNSVNRGYGLPKGEHRFSLFNTSRWSKESFEIDHQCGYIPPELDVVPILYQGEFSTLAVQGVLEQLRLGGSAAAPQFMRPEGCVVFHTAANIMFKATLENDEMPKALAARKPSAARETMFVEVTASFDSEQPCRGELALAA